ncbi:hypothetical protein [Spirillospora sp. CA-128828]|uniref:hypothetical protein n=1 Tax=Spirillospora sp. CA-128828 TaxID=3240033 RepID=UPI003D91B192
MAVRGRLGGHEADDGLLGENEIRALVVGYDESAMRQDQGGRPTVLASENRHMIRLRGMLRARTRRLLARQARGNGTQPFF